MYSVKYLYDDKDVELITDKDNPLKLIKPINGIQVMMPVFKFESNLRTEKTEKK